MKRVLETNEASDDELEAEHQETIALITIAKQRRAEVDQARQFFREKKEFKGIWSISNIKPAREKHSFQKYVDIFRFERKRFFLSFLCRGNLRAGCFQVDVARCQDRIGLIEFWVADGSLASGTCLASECHHIASSRPWHRT